MGGASSQPTLPAITEISPLPLSPSPDTEENVKTVGEPVGLIVPYSQPVRDLTLPLNPDLTQWVACVDWDDRQHWFKPGDLVEYHRRNCAFNHWAIYIGNGLVAHFTSHDVLTSSRNILLTLTTASAVVPSLNALPAVETGMRIMRLAVTVGEMVLEQTPPPRPGALSQPGIGCVRIDKITDVAAEDEFRVNNLVGRARDYTIRAWEDIFRMIWNYVQQGTLPYSVVKMNCEHFATYLRYKRKK